MGMEFPTLKRLQEVVMKQVSILALILVLVTFVAPLGVFAETASAAPALLDVRYAECPIMGGKALTDVAIIHENKIYHFCCPSCIDTFKKDPAAAIAKIKDAKEVVLTVTNPDGKCPVCGKLEPRILPGPRRHDHLLLLQGLHRQGHAESGSGFRSAGRCSAGRGLSRRLPCPCGRAGR